MKIVIITGNKGGVGKSYMSIMLADYLIRNNKPLLVSDTESSKGQATTWNVIRRHVEENKIVEWSLIDTKGYEKMMDYLERNKTSDVTAIIDTGASMMNSLLENLKTLSEMQEECNINVEIVFVSGPLPDSAVAAKEYLKAQADLTKPLRTTFVLLSPTDDNQSDYAIEQNKKIQDAIPKLNGIIKFLGKIRQDYFDRVMKDFELPSSMLNNVDIGYGFRKNYNLWLKSCFDEVAKTIVGD
jgi:anion-transporting  ArsA/GET3 family ATPase